MLFEDCIEEFQGEYRFLSNFWPSEFSYLLLGKDGFKVEYRFKTVEHFYQAMKFRSQDYGHFLNIIQAKTPGRAKKLGKKGNPDIEKFNTVRVPIMRLGLQLKFEIPELREALLNTGDAYLQEGNYWVINIGALIYANIRERTF